MARKKLTPEEERQRAELYERFYDEELAKPLDFFRHDSNASDDEALQELRDVYGFEALGHWWLFVEKLAAKKGHSFDVARSFGWERLARELEFDTAYEAEVFAKVLADLGLIDAELLGEGKIASERMCANANEYAVRVASKRVGAWVANKGNGPGEGAG